MGGHIGGVAHQSRRMTLATARVHLTEPLAAPCISRRRCSQSRQAMSFVKAKLTRRAQVAFQAVGLRAGSREGDAR